MRPKCTNGHELDSLSVKPSYYKGKVLCDTCGKVIKDRDVFFHCKLCKQDFCKDCKYEKLLQETISRNNTPTTKLNAKTDDDSGKLKKEVDDLKKENKRL